MARVTAKELAELHGVSVRQVQNWKKCGLKHGSRKNPRGGKRLWTFSNEGDVLPFLASKGIVTKFIEARAAERVKKEGESSQAGSIDKEKARLPGMLGSIERLKQQEVATAVKLIHLKRSQASAAEILAIQRLYIKDITALHKGEMQAIEYGRRMGEVVDLDGIRKRWSRLATATMNNVMGIGHRVIPRLRGHLKTSSSAGTVKRMIDEACRAALRQLKEYRVS